MRRLRGQAGQTAAELVGMLLLVALVIGALATSSVPSAIAGGVEDAICDISGGECGATPPASERTSTQRTPEDGDGDGVRDARERRLGLDPTTADADGDGLPDGRELELGSDVRNADSDGDGVSDGDEAGSGGAMRPNDADSDDDGLTDAEELAVGTDPGEEDGDGDFGQLGDGLTDAEELEHGTDPNKFDTDGDRYSDGWEVEHGRDPTEADTPLSEKVLDIFLDDPFSLGRGALIKGGAKKIVEKILRKGVRKVGDAKSIKDAAKIRRERLEAIRDRAPGARRTVGPLTRQQDTALEDVMRNPNRLEHIFGQGGKHNLGPLTHELGSQRAVVREAILRIPRSQPEGVFKITTRIGEHEVTVTGRMLDGVPRISNMWVP